MVRRLLALLLALLLVTGLVACGDDDSSSTDDAPSDDTTTTVGEEDFADAANELCADFTAAFEGLTAKFDEAFAAIEEDDPEAIDEAIGVLEDAFEDMRGQFEEFISDFEALSPPDDDAEDAVAFLVGVFETFLENLDQLEEDAIEAMEDGDAEALEDLEADFTAAVDEEISTEEADAAEETFADLGIDECAGNAAEDEDADAEPGDSAIEEFESGVSDEGEEYTDFEQITDDSGTIVVEVPVEWDDVDGSPNSSGDPSLRAGPDLGAPAEEVPVLGYTAVEVANPAGQDLDGLISTVSDATTQGECTEEPAQPYSDPAFTGRIQAFVDCGGDDRAWLFVAATPDNGDPFVAVIFGQAVTVADVDAIQHAFDTFNITA